VAVHDHLVVAGILSDGDDVLHAMALFTEGVHEKFDIYHGMKDAGDGAKVVWKRGDRNGWVAGFVVAESRWAMGCGVSEGVPVCFW
jgi:hypothetical protein